MIPEKGSENALFLSMKNNRMSVDAIEKMVVKYAKIFVPQKKITPHKLRSTFGTQLYQETGDLYLVAETLGHSSVETSKRYYGKKNLMTSCTDGSAYLQRYPPEQLSIINASGH